MKESSLGELLFKVNGLSVYENGYTVGPLIVGFGNSVNQWPNLDEFLGRLLTLPDYRMAAEMYIEGLLFKDE